METGYHFSKIVRNIFNLRIDSDEQGTVENIRKNVDFHGANAWTLVFAIFVASIGLNMNSAAVIIGAMLISPLMGPILGFGLALGINDGELLKKAIRNLSITMTISVLTSTVYFLLSPLHDAQSELLARTQPTFYDVMIAFFGGAAGIVSISRKERGQAVAGVAIATALMPPLCTAGYALSTGNLKFLAGALYLFLINSVFIALSTFIFVRYMKFQVVKFQDKEGKTKIRRWVTGVVVVMVIPSLILAWNLLQESRFKINGERFLREQFHFKNAVIVDKKMKFSYSKPKMEISVVGEVLSTEQVESLKQRLSGYGLASTDFQVRQLTQKESEAMGGASSVESELSALRQQLSSQTAQTELSAQIKSEMKSLFPELDEILFTADTTFIVWRKRASKDQWKKIEEFIKLRTQHENLKVIHLLRA